MTATLLHISDPHFGDSEGVLNRSEVSRVLSTLLRKAGPDVVPVLSGDISFKGQAKGYAEARDALTQVLDDAGVPRARVIVCPGNHDVVNSASGTAPFEAFDMWSAGLRNDKRCTFSANSCRRVTLSEADFLVINSAHHGNIEYGLVNLQDMDTVLGEIASTPAQGRPRIAVLHHHLVPFSGRGDESTTRNAYQVLTRLIKHGFSLALHGHQHALLELGVGGGSMKLFGVGSFRYITPGFINGASIYRIDDANQVSADHYAISKDATDFLRAFTDF
jgi:3',5'-cyclic AMP phosphodiesterase CpdA